MQANFKFFLVSMVSCFFLCTGIAFPNQTQKLSPDLRVMLNEGVAKVPLTAQKLVTQQAEASIVRVIVQANCQAARLEQSGMKVISHIGDVFTGTIAFSSIPDLSDLPDVIAIKTPALLKPQLTIAVPLIKADKIRSGIAGGFTGFTGKNVITGLVDSGIDVNHQDFKNPDGTTRILYIWDQTLDGSPPSDFTFGAECTKADIDAGTCTHKDVAGHGTQVAGIAAGNGRATGNGFPANRYIGVAPEADLIVVNADEPNVGFFEDRIIDGINYILTRASALGKPVVINLSLGGQDSPHDGTSLLDRVIDAASGPGKIFVIAAGNEGNNDPLTQPRPPLHADGRLISNGSFDLVTFSIPDDECRNTGALNDFIEIIMWYEGSDSYSIKITSPHGFTAEALTGQVNAENTRSTQDGYIYIDNAFGGADSVNFDNQARIVIEDFFELNSGGQSLPRGGQWSITITALGNSSLGTYDLWIPSSQFCNRINDSGFTASSSSTNIFNSKLIATPGDTISAVTVGAFVSRNSWVNVNGTNVVRSEDVVGDIAFFSSPGPTRDQRDKPEISAPGQNIGSALVSPPEGNVAFPIEQYLDDGVHVISRGTSFSAPMVTGMAALMLQNDHIKSLGVSTLQSYTIKDWLKASAVSDQFTGTTPNSLWGSGKLDVLGAMKLNPPKGPVLQITNVNKDSIELVWTIDPPATSIMIERQVGENGIFAPYTTVSGVTSYTDVNLLKNTFYGYRLTAVFGELQSSPSNTESATTSSGGGGGGGGCFITTILP